jgi:hypothetical protein
MDIRPMPSRRNAARHAPAAAVFVPTARHLWLAALGLLLAARRMTRKPRRR